jgi:DNA-binding NarL/FixJ family response regulator
VGGLGYVLKRRLVSDLSHAICEARRGRPFVSPLIAPTHGMSPS